jgi:hypothetical protein
LRKSDRSSGAFSNNAWGLIAWPDYVLCHFDRYVHKDQKNLIYPHVSVKIASDKPINPNLRFLLPKLHLKAIFAIPTAWAKLKRVKQIYNA